MLINDALLEQVRTALILVLKIAGPMLGAGIVIGLLISIFQSVTQIQEQTLTLVPKIVVMTIVAVGMLPWIVSMIAEFSVQMFRLV
jgi:flagellar biosynthesis protein FliQ